MAAVSPSNDEKLDSCIDSIDFKQLQRDIPVAPYELTHSSDSLGRKRFRTE